jgi:hypothetical protein
MSSRAVAQSGRWRENGPRVWVFVIYYANLISGPIKNNIGFLDAKSSHSTRTRSVRRTWLLLWEPRIGQQTSRQASSHRFFLKSGIKYSFFLRLLQFSECYISPTRVLQVCFIVRFLKPIGILLSLVSCLLHCLRVSRRSYAHAMPAQRQSRDHAARGVEKICNAQCRSVRRPAYVTARTCGRTGAPRPTVSWPPSSTPRT